MATREEYKLGIDVVNPAPSGTGGDLIQDNFKTIADLIDGHGNALSGLYSALSGKAAVSHSHSTSDITGLDTALSGKAAASHTHSTSDVTGLDTALSGKAAASHTHSTSDVTGLDTALSGKAAASHTHSISNITGLDTALSGKAPASHSHSYNDLSDKPTIPAAYSLPTASTSQLGGVKVDGSTIKINNGVISAPSSGGGGASTLSDLSDVGIGNPQTGDVLTFTGSVWQNSTPEAASADAVLNRQNCDNFGVAALAVGMSTQASADFTLTFGYGGSAYGRYSLVGGAFCDTTVGADSSLTMGESSSNRGKNSLLIGNRCINFAKYSISTGYFNYNTFENAVTANGLVEGYYGWDLDRNKYGNAGFTAFRVNTYPFKLLDVAPTDILIARIDILYFNKSDFTTNAVSFKIMIINQEIKACEIFKNPDDTWSSVSDVSIDNGVLMYYPLYVVSSAPDFQVGIFFTRYSNSKGGGSSSSSSSSSAY